MSDFYSHRPKAVDEDTFKKNWERTFSKRTRMKIFHYHRSQHAAIHAEFEEQAKTILRDMHPFDADDFELMDVQDVPEGPSATDEDARTYRDE